MLVYFFTVLEEKTPKVKDLHRYVIKEYAPEWRDIGLELDLKTTVLDIIAKDNPLNCTACFEKTLDMWLKSNPNATWKILEVAITNARRAHLGLKPVTDVQGEHVTSLICNLSFCTFLVKMQINIESDYGI